MNKIILIMSFLVVMALIVSGCTSYPGIVESPQNSPRFVANPGGECDVPDSSRVIGLGYVTCYEGKTCRTNDGVEYSVPCVKRGNSCYQPPCQSGDWWVSGYCRPEYTIPDEEVESS
ncbi:MAG: hypothetical protein KKH88_01755 [Nanoarchaeota archaeon]|nr:hypothetical protein [Nanoarchaeota archaeon]